MNDLQSAFLLLAVPGLPLLLALPALRARLPWPSHIALLPAIILLAVPSVASIELPWLLFGAGLGADRASRIVLAMSVVLWSVAATLLTASGRKFTDNRLTVLFLLTMSGNLGAVLATDVVSFFAFSSLMGYGFYALLVDAGDASARRAGRIYIGFLIVADLALFEALLITASMTREMGFEAVRHAVSSSSSPGLYVSMVVVGFAARAGAWPLHFWLPLAFGSARPAVALLLGGVPIAMGLLGIVRWLPLGEITLPGPGLIIQILGVAAILYAILAAVKQRVRLKLLPAYAAIIATGLFAIALGAGVANPAFWHQYGEWAHIFIVLLGFGMAAVVAAIWWLQASSHVPAAPAKQADDPPLWLERLAGAVVRWGGETGFNMLPRLRASWLDLADRILHIEAWRNALDAAEHSLQRWILAVTLLLLLGIVIALLSM